MYSLEDLTGTIVLVRYGVNHSKYGDPYQGTVIAHIIDDVATMKGLVTMPPKSWVKALFDELKANYKITSITWERIKSNEVKNVVS